MTTIKQDDLIQSVADALQYISYYHPVDYIKGLAAAYEREESPAAKDAMAQILINSRMAAEGQDRKSTRLNSSHLARSRMPSSA